ncbi:MAG: AAA domain-containing protein, partial [Acidimicrobiales bacterium]
MIDTLEEAQRAVQFFAHRKAISLIDAWGYQHQINRPEGVDHHTWLTAIMELPAKAAQVREALELGRMLLTFSAGLQPDAPEDLLRAALASVAREIVLVLGPLADAASRSSVDVRVDGVPIRNRADASRAIAAFRAASTRSRCHHLLPPEWRWHCDPLDVEPDALVEMLGICAVAAAVPGRARSSDLTASSVRRLIERIEVDRTRVELLAEHTRVIGGLRRTLAGCVPKSPATTALDAALEAESSTDYRAAMDALEAEREMASRASRFAEAETALIAAHPDLVAAFRVGDERATAVLRYLEAYQSLRDYRSEVRRWKSEVGSSEEIHLELAELHKSFRRLEQSISGMMCWSRAIDRIRDRRELRSALSALTTAMDKVPKTRTAKSYPARMKALRDATKSAAPAIPCWVMPIDRIAEVLGYPTGEDRFDVVIVDESSQAWFTASFLYAIADQVIVVGDDLQTSPAAQILPDDNIRAVVDEHIPGHRLANQVGADLSLYDVASVMTGPDVMVDHFRCVPEIIEISTRLSYEPKGKRLLPSRVRPRGSLEPVRQVEVRGSRTAHGANVVEAEALVSQVAKCHADPAYSGMDFGVVVVGSNSAAHIKKLRELLLQMLGPTAITDRDIEVGTPAEFQGSERNVMFMSLVEAPPEGGRLRTWPHEHTGQNRRRVQQLNVAVSRAKDQLWVFRSFGPQALGPEDVRGVILQTSEAEFPSIEAELEKCESQFERDVVLALARAETGIRIRTQVEAIGYSIDIVV